MLPQIYEELRNQGIDTRGGIPLGITRNSKGEAILFYKGSKLEPKYLMEVDTLISTQLTLEEVTNEFVGLDTNVEYFYSFDWDITDAGFVDIKNRNGDIARHYFYMHQPTGDKCWYRKIWAETTKGVMVKLWEKFDKENWDGIVMRASEMQANSKPEVIIVKGELE